MEENRTPEETAAVRKELEQKKRNHRFRNMLFKFTLIGTGLFTTTSNANAQGIHYERVNTMQQQAQQPIRYGTAAWAESQGFVYSREFSIGLNRRGTYGPDGFITHRGYKAAFIKYDHQDFNRSEVLFIPNYPEDAKESDRQYVSTVRQWKKTRNRDRDFDNPYKQVTPVGMFWGLIK